MVETLFAIGFGAFLYWLAFRFWRRSIAIADTPTVPVAGAFIGRCEVSGVARRPLDAQGAEAPEILTPVSSTACTWWRTKVEYYRRDDDGPDWHTLVDVTSTDPIDITDGPSRMRCWLQGAHIIATESLQHDESPTAVARARAAFDSDDSDLVPATAASWKTSEDGAWRWHDGVGTWVPAAHVSPDGAAVWSEATNQWVPVFDRQAAGWFTRDSWDRRLRVHEWVVTAGSPLFVHGTARVDATGAALEFRSSDDLEITGSEPVGYQGSDTALIVSTKDERSTSRGIRRAAWGFLIGALALIGIGVLLVGNNFRPEDAPLSWWLPWLVVWGAVVVVATIPVAMLRGWNRVVEVKHQAEEAWHAIDIALARRSALIPNLHAVVTASAVHERSVLDLMATIRHEVDAPPRPSASDEVALAPQLVVLAERNPQLRTNQNFLALQGEIRRTEDKIAFARGFYNDAVTVYRDRTRTVPGMIIKRFLAPPKDFVLFDAVRPGSAIA